MFSPQIESETEAAIESSNATLDKVEDLETRLDALKRKYLENEINVQKAEREAENAETLADQAEEVGSGSGCVTGLVPVFFPRRS